MDFGEFLVVLVVGIVVLGPKELPKMLRKAGQWAGKARRFAANLRAESGIDDVLREGSLGEDLREIRALARGEIDSVSRGVSLDDQRAHEREIKVLEDTLLREREYPQDGIDGYGAVPDTAILYDELPASKYLPAPVYMPKVAEALATPAAPSDPALSPASSALTIDDAMPAGSVAPAAREVVS